MQNAPPPNSWASDPSNDVAVIHITIRPGGTLTLPKSNTPGVHRSLFLVEGFEGVEVDGTVVKEKAVLDMDSSTTVQLQLPRSCQNSSEFLLLQGKPIGEPVVQHGPFVMNSRDEIRQAFTDYQRTQFGGWPWNRDDMVFPREKGRFALLDGKEITPNDDRCIAP